LANRLYWQHSVDEMDRGLAHTSTTAAGAKPAAFT
jgi:hypothetical protein